MSNLNSFFTDNYDEDEKPIYKAMIEKAMTIVDNGQFFREPIVYLYRIIGIFIVLSFFGFMYICFSDDKLSLGKFMQYVDGGVNIAIALVVMALSCAFGLLYWINRSNSLRSKIQGGNDIVVIPIIADFIQCLFEWWGLTLMIFIPLYTLYLGILGQLFMHMGHYLDFLLITIASSIGIILLGYGITCFGHFLGENIRAVSTIANNVRDLGDIHRAATMDNETIEKEEDDEDKNDNNEGE